jgi:5-methylcytosine-specific restriction protein A
MPLCERCAAKGLARLATEVDHKAPLYKGGEESEDNRQSLCAECHKVKTAEDMGHARRTITGLDGWPVE